MPFPSIFIGRFIFKLRTFDKDEKGQPGTFFSSLSFVYCGKPSLLEESSCAPSPSTTLLSWNTVMAHTHFGYTFKSDPFLLPCQLSRQQLSRQQALALITTLKSLPSLCRNRNDVSFRMRRQDWTYQQHQVNSV
jgi:hypothetical protein